MSMTRIDDIAFEIDGDQINLEQSIGCGEVSYITLHRIHLAHLAGQMGLLVSDPSAERTTARLCRRLRTLHERIRRAAHVVGDIDALGANEPPSAEQLELWYLRDLADDFIADLDSEQQANAKQNPDGTQTEPTGFSSSAQSPGQLLLIEERLK